MTLIDLKQHYDKLDELFRQEAVTAQYFAETDGAACREELARIARMIEERRGLIVNEVMDAGYDREFADILAHAYDYKTVQYYEESRKIRRKVNYGSVGCN